MMRLGFGLAGLLAALLPMGPVHAQTGPERDLVPWYITSATKEIPDMARMFGWTEPVALSEGDALDTNAERISLNQAEIRKLVAGTGYQQQDAVRMIIAHEVWHYVEYKRGLVGAPGGGAAERRLGECRADVMAARYMASKDDNSSTYGFDFSPQRSIAGSLWRTKSKDHPTPDQRELAAHLGALSIANSKSDVADRADIDLLVGMETGDDPVSWSQRICNLVVHAQEAAMGSIVITRPDSSTENGKTKFRLSYSNLSPRRIEVSTTIIVQQSDTLDGMDRRKRWIFPLITVVEPGATEWVERALAGAQPISNEHVWTYFDAQTDDRHALIAARFLPGLPTKSPWMLASGLSNDDAAFALALRSLANAARTGFADFRGIGVARYDGSPQLIFPSTLGIPGSRSTNIILQNDGAARTDAFFKDGGSPEAVQAMFTRVRSQILRIWPNSPRKDVAPDRFTTSISRYCNLELQIIGDEAYAFVSLSLRPNMLGLAN